HHREPIELRGGDLRQTGTDLGRVHVAVHRGDRRYSLEVDHHLPLAYVTTEQDVIDLPEHVEHFRPQETVRVGDDPEPHVRELLPFPALVTIDRELVVVEHAHHREIHTVRNLMMMTL